jgi:hypothetical protein
MPHRLSHTMYMFDTDATFHLLMSLLNVGLEEKSETMLVTAAVSQSAIGPYVVAAVVGVFTHVFTAVYLFASVMAVSAATCAGRKRSSTKPARRCDPNAMAHLHRSDRTCCTAVQQVATRYVLHCRSAKNTHVAALMDTSR